jgi:hypothetical protein
MPPGDQIGRQRRRAVLLACALAVGGAATPIVAVPEVTMQTGQGSAQTGARPPALTLVMTLHVQVGPPLELGDVPGGRRRIIPILGGTFEGPSVRGKVLAGGADWQMVRADGLAELDTRYALQTEAGQIIYIQNAGIRHASPEATKKLLAGEPVDPSQVYFKTVPRFETSAPDLQWLTRAIFVGTGERYPSEVVMRVWRVD